jgi:hypothetical protein
MEVIEQDVDVVTQMVNGYNSLSSEDKREFLRKIRKEKTIRNLMVKKITTLLRGDRLIIETRDSVAHYHITAQEGKPGGVLFERNPARSLGRKRTYTIKIQ